MGRVAGTPRSIRSAKAWKEKVAYNKWWASRKPPKPPLATLPTAQRQKLLLWIVKERHLDGLLVNWLRCPKYTDDMKCLVKKNALEIKRERIIGNRIGTVLYLTKLGHAMVQNSKFKQSELNWIIQSFDSNSLR